MLDRLTAADDGSPDVSFPSFVLLSSPASFHFLVYLCSLIRRSILCFVLLRFTFFNFEKKSKSGTTISFLVLTSSSPHLHTSDHPLIIHRAVWTAVPVSSTPRVWSSSRTTSPPPHGATYGRGECFIDSLLSFLLFSFAGLLCCRFKMSVINQLF